MSITSKGLHKGLVVLVTGGTRGIGKAIVQLFLREGAKVAYCARTVTGKEFEGDVKQEDAISRVFGTACDISKTEQLEAWVPAIIKKWGRIDVLVHNASAMICNSTPESWDTTYHTDLRSYVTLINLTLPYLRVSPSPSIVGIASVSASNISGEVLISVGHAGSYGALKAAMVHYSHQLAWKLATEGTRIRVNTVSPGHIYFDGCAWQRTERELPEDFKMVLESIPGRRMGTPEEVAEAVVWIASERASYVNGTNLRVDGCVGLGIQL